MAAVAVKQAPVSLEDRIVEFIDSTVTKHSNRIAAPEIRALVCDKFDLNGTQARELIRTLRDKLRECHLEFRRGKGGGLVRSKPSNVIQGPFRAEAPTSGAPLIQRLRACEDLIAKMDRRIVWLERQLRG